MSNKDKSNLFIVISIVVILSVYFIINLNKITFTESKHERNENYGAIFETYIANRKGLTISIEKSIYEKKEAKKIFKQIEKDYKRIKKAFSDSKNINIYIVEATIEGGVEVFENSIYCSIKDITSVLYRPALIQASVGFKEPWKCYGAQALVFNMKPNDSLLKEYYLDSDDLNIISLFAGYFNSHFSDDKTIKVAENTALSLSSFISSPVALFECQSTSEYANAWLSSIGIEKKYEEKYDLKAYSNYSYSISRDYPLVMDSENERIYFSVVEDSLDSSEDIMLLLHSYVNAKNEILNYIKDNAPLNSHVVIDNMRDKIIIYLQEESFSSRNRTIYVEPILSVLLHEVINVLIPHNGSTFNWYNEGIASFLSLKYDMGVLREGRYKSIFIDNPNYSEEVKALVKITRDYYLAHKQKPDSAEEFDSELLFEAMAVATLKNPSLRSISGIVKPVGDSDFNYPEMFLFTKYLIEKHGGLDVFLSLCFENHPFESYYDMDYETLKALWISSLD